MVMCPEQQQNANWNQVEIEIWIVKGRNLPRTNSTKCETQNIFAKKQQNEHTPEQSKNIGKYLYTCTEFQARISYWDFGEILWL